MLASAFKSIEVRVSMMCAAAAILVALLGYGFGVAHGFNKVMPEAIEYENVKVAMAVSRYAYGLDYGHLADRRVYDELRKNGFTTYPQFLKPLGKTFPAIESDAEQLNRALKAAASLGDLKPRPGLFTGIEPVEPQDLGGADFYWLGFKLFGLKVQSWFNLYYLLHVGSILLFIGAYWRRLDATLVLLPLVAGHFLAQGFLIGVPPEQIFGVATPYAQRFIAALGIISGLHIAFAVMRPTPRTIANVVLLASQTAILTFVISIRSSAMWELLWPATIVGLFIVALLAHHWNLLRWRLRVKPVEVLHRVLGWPVVTLCAVLVLMTAFNSAHTNPLYKFSDEFIDHHMFWHSAYASLPVHPEWASRFGKYLLNDQGQPAGGDELPMVAGQKWLAAHYGLSKSYMLSPVRGWRYRTTERIIREVYLDFLMRHPRYTLELHLIYKPRLWYMNFLEWHRTAFRGMPLWGLWLVGGTMAFAVAAAALAGRRGRGSLNLACAGFVLLLGSVWAFAPGIVIVTSPPVMSDQCIMVDAALMGWLLWGVIAVARLVGERVRASAAAGSNACMTETTP